MTGAMNIDRAWLHRFAIETRHLTERGLSVANTCILTTKIGLAVLDRFGVPARPQAVYATVHNLEGWRLAEQGVPVSQWPDSAWSIGMADDQAQVPGQWNGHLVIIVRRPGQPRLLIDLTADQFDRPEVGMVVGGPIFMDIGSTWTPQDPLFTVLGDPPSTVVSYRPMPPGHPEATRWQQSPDWAETQDAVNAAVERLAERLAERAS